MGGKKGENCSRGFRLDLVSLLLFFKDTLVGIFLYVDVIERIYATEKDFSSFLFCSRGAKRENMKRTKDTSFFKRRSEASRPAGRDIYKY